VLQRKNKNVEKEMMKEGRAEVSEAEDVTPISAILCDKFSWHAYRTTQKVNRSRDSFNQVSYLCRLDSDWKPWTHRHQISCSQLIVQLRNATARQLTTLKNI